MSEQLSTLQEKLCNALQEGLTICPRPYADLAEFLGSDEERILREVRELKQSGIIRRIGAAINARALGRVSTLVTAHVPDEDIPAVARAVNALEGVSHNYLRKHYYNLWFTLQGSSGTEIERTLANLSGRLGIDFHSLPVIRMFKLDVRFDAEGEGRAQTAEAVKVPGDMVAELSEDEKHVLSGLQGELEATAKPFDFLCKGGMSERQVLGIIVGLLEKGVVRRIGAVLDYRRLGFTANVMFCCSAPAQAAARAGENLARFRVVSHCYERRTFEGWPYNLFAMMHGRSMGEIQQVVDKFTGSEAIDSYELLPTQAELKKRPVRQQFGEQ
ncbi:MAG TPA: hypothetical protein VMX13_12995 [Sedimentisphaerales bacterium]|nr:hypothetical protein [Sedimentisphaerales bacterium]